MGAFHRADSAATAIWGKVTVPNESGLKTRFAPDTATLDGGHGPGEQGPTPARARMVHRIRRTAARVLVATLSLAVLACVVLGTVIARVALDDTAEQRLEDGVAVARNLDERIGIDQLIAQGRGTVDPAGLDGPDSAEPAGRAELRRLVSEASRSGEPAQASFDLDGRPMRARAVPLDPGQPGTSVVVALTRAHPGAFTRGVSQVLAVAGLLVLVLALGAVVVARRGSRVTDVIFGQQDRLMLAVAHELRSPLGRALAAADDGLDGTIDHATALQRTTRHVETTSELIADLVEVTRIMSGAIARPQDHVDLADVAATAAHITTVGEATVELDLSPATTIGSARLLRRAVSNLVRNAARHAYRDGPGTITVRVDDRGISVLDDGPGTSPERLEDIRYETPLSRRKPGAGLGLTLCGWVAELHEGALELANRPGGGFEARLVLPTDPGSLAEEIWP